MWADAPPKVQKAAWVHPCHWKSLEWWHSTRLCVWIQDVNIWPGTLPSWQKTHQLKRKLVDGAGMLVTFKMGSLAKERQSFYVGLLPFDFFARFVCVCCCKSPTCIAWLLAWVRSGFALEFLCSCIWFQLISMKSTANRNYTLVHYVVETLMERDPSLLELPTIMKEVQECQDSESSTEASSFYIFLYMWMPANGRIKEGKIRCVVPLVIFFALALAGFWDSVSQSVCSKPIFNTFFLFLCYFLCSVPAVARQWSGR